jgi:hypothetical protein
LLTDLAASWRRDLCAADKAERTVTFHGEAVRFFVEPEPKLVHTDEDVSRLFKATAGPEFVDRRGHALLRVLFDCYLPAASTGTSTTRRCGSGSDAV